MIFKNQEIYKLLQNEFFEFFAIFIIRVKIKLFIFPLSAGSRVLANLRFFDDF